MKYLIGIVVLIILVGGFLALNNKQPIEPAMIQSFSFEEIEFDFGTLKQSGGIVTHEFPFTYNGIETVTVTGLPTSCGCTSATIRPSALSPGTEGVITVAFDPNLHAEPDGHFYKTVTLLTQPSIDAVPELKIWASIDLDLGQDAYKEQVHEDDF